MTKESQKRLDNAIENHNRGNRGLDSAVGCLTLIAPLLVFVAIIAILL